MGFARVLGVEINKGVCMVSDTGRQSATELFSPPWLLALQHVLP